MTKETIRPLGENVLVRPEKEDSKTKSGLVIPDTVSGEKPQKGEVMAVGDDKKIKVKKGQKIIFAKYSGTEIELEKVEYLIIKAEDILAVLE